MRFLLCFLLLTSILFSDDSGVSLGNASLQGEPSSYIEGCVSAITGQIFYQQDDLTIRGASPLTVRRRYTSLDTIYPDFAWYLFYHLRATLKLEDLASHIETCEPDGTKTTYLSKHKIDKKGNREVSSRFSPIGDTYAKGQTNTGQDFLGGHYHPSQSIAEWGGEDLILITLSNGGKRVYRKASKDKVKAKVAHKFLLEKEQLANGHILHFEWNKDKTHLKFVALKNPDETKTFASFSLHKEKTKDKNITPITLQTTDQRSLSYSFNQKKKNSLFLLQNKRGGNSSDETLEYSDNADQLQKRILTEKCNLEFEFSKKKKVKKINAPRESEYTIKYHEGSTDAYDPYGNKTFYLYDVDTLRLKLIEHSNADYNLLQKETFSWNKKGQLLNRSLLESDGTLSSKRTYTYDPVGNIISEVLHGAIIKEGSNDKAQTKREYSTDGRNLLLKEILPSGKETTYEYLIGTNLPTAVYQGEEKKIYRRTFYRYNEDHLLVEKIEDDGTVEDIDDLTGVSQRHIQQIDRIGESQFYGMPQVIREYHCNETSPQSLLTTTYLKYDKVGLIQQKTVTSPGTEKDKVYTYKYDEKGRITDETNPLDQVATYEYDTIGNKTKEIDFSKKTTVYEYDDSNNLVLENVEGKITQHCYNKINQRISTIDHLGYKTTYTYDALGNLLTTTHPDEGTSQFTYDAAGNQTSSTDPKGNQTITTYNAYGKPLLITYPDDTTEEYTYTLSGEIENHTNQEGLTTSYTYDVFGRELTKNTSFDKEVLTTETKQYSGFQLLEETDPLGRTTHYQYDAAGRLIKKTFLEQETSYEYDNFNRQTSVTEQDTITEFTYDCLDRVIEEKKYLVEDQDFLIYKRLTSYNAQGEIASYITYPDGEEATETFEYDIWGRKVAHTDPLDRTTTIAYSNAAPLTVTTTDPKGRKTIETFDFRDQLLSRIQTTADHQTLSESTYQYDLSGNLIQSIHKRLPSSSKYVVAFSYDNMNRLIKETEQGSKTTKYSYTETGLLSKVTKPSKVELNYTYNSLGHLIRLHSSKTKTDESIDYTYEYNLIGELTSSKDGAGEETARNLDDYCNVEEETLANGLTFFSKYDPYHRSIEFSFLDSPTIKYTYQGPYLTQVDFDSFTHTYEYDKALNLIKETNLLNNNTSYSLDLLGRPLLIDNNFFTQAIEYDEVGNITTKDTDNVLSAFDYDPLDQLIQEPMASYGYDSLHNRTKKNDASYTLNPLNQIKSTGKNSYEYNPNGNLIEVRGADPLTIEYDALDRPIAFIHPQKTKAEHTYDAQHRRLTKKTSIWKNDQWIPISFIKYLWQDDYEIGHVDQDGKLTYRILGRTPFAEIGSSILIVNNHQHLIPIHDIHGNILKLIDLKGRAIEERTFSAFGEGAPSSLIPWGFVSKRHDTETDLIYFGRRYYSPELGRFLTPDPEKFTDSYNLYQYTLNNPLNRLDPHGLTISMLPLSVPSLDEDSQQMSIGVMSGVAQWTVNTARDWATYAGGMHGTEDMSFLDTYNLHMQTDASFRQSAARTIETSLGADLDNPFYQYSFQGAYMGADFAYAAMIPFPKFDKAGKAIQGVQRQIRNPSTKGIASVAARIFEKPRSLPQKKAAIDITKNIHFTDHALKRAAERGVSMEAILNAIKSPLKIGSIQIDHLGRPSQRFIGKTAEVVLNPETQKVVSVNPTSTKKAKKLSNELFNANKH